MTELSGALCSGAVLAVQHLFWLGLLILRWKSSVDDSPNSLHQAIAGTELGGLDRLVEDNFHRTGLHGKAAFGHGFVSSDNGDWNHRDRSFRREIKRPFFEGKKLAIP